MVEEKTRFILRYKTGLLGSGGREPFAPEFSSIQDAKKWFDYNIPNWHNLSNYCEVEELTSGKRYPMPTEKSEVIPEGEIVYMLPGEEKPTFLQKLQSRIARLENLLVNAELRIEIAKARILALEKMEKRAKQ